ncbi:XylR N-terminal domain-containing protein [Pseudobacillus sp. FSL P4-0506]|uniref:XylR N-terminal domain-containing protein n=1 Tax=unclassified Pseudobacillus TaxID=2619284 RepID=UPI0030FC71B5
MSNQTFPETSLHLSEREGIIQLDDERIVLTSSAVFGTLRKDLAENIGNERMKGFLIRYGWNLGVNDAKRALKKDFSSIEEVLRQGSVFHALKGYTKAKTTKFQIHFHPDKKVEDVHVEGIWYSSYEAEENSKQFGVEKHPVCHTLIGYASGYYSTVCGHTVIFKEIACKGTGDPVCRYIGKSLHCWQGKADEELNYYENQTIVKELEVAYNMLLEERNNLEKAAIIHERLTEEVINGNDLQSIAAAVYETTSCPLLIENTYFEKLACAGITDEEYVKIEAGFKELLHQGDDKVTIKETKRLKDEQHQRLMTPIRLQKKILGYCSFIYETSVRDFPKVDSMILERAATVCSLYLLNEKTSFEAMERMKGHFLEQILNGYFPSKQEILKRGGYMNIDLSLSFRMIVLTYQSRQSHPVNELFFHEQLMETIFHYFKRQKVQLVTGQRDGNIILLIQTDSLTTEEKLPELCSCLIDHLGGVYPAYLFRMGVSTKGKQIEQAATYYKEAIIALKIGAYNETLFLFENLGVTGILLSSQDKEAVKQKAHYLLGPLFESEGAKKNELVKTLYIFLSNGGNLEKTMNDLSLSMSGLRYRVEKIEYLLDKDLRDPQVSYELLLTLKALIVAGDITIL